LSVSSGTNQQKNSFIEYYTLSGDQKLRLDISVVHKIATIIGRVKKHKQKFEVIEKQHGIYQIVFNEPGTQNISIGAEANIKYEVTTK
jgi:hypothetical protein